MLAAIGVPIWLGLRGALGLLKGSGFLDFLKYLGFLKYLLVGYISLVALCCLYWLVVAIVRLYHLAVGRLRGSERKPFTALSKTAAFTVAAGVLFGLISLCAMQGVRSSKPIFGYSIRSELRWPESYGPRTWVPRLMAFIGYPPFANLTNADVSQKKANWTSKTGNDLDSVIPAQLSGADLRYALANRAFFAGADLSLTDLTGADLRRADLSGANLSFANLSGATLNGVNLSIANLGDADLSGADLRGADLSGADLSVADLPGANLSWADLRGANLSDANLSDADLSDTDLTSSDFRSILSYENTTVNPEAVKGAKTQTWEKAFYDCMIIETLHLPLDNNVKLFEELPKDQQDRYKIYEKPPEPCPSAPKQ